MAAACAGRGTGAWRLSHAPRKAPKIIWDVLDAPDTHFRVVIALVVIGEHDLAEALGVNALKRRNPRAFFCISSVAPTATVAAAAAISPAARSSPMLPVLYLTRGGTRPPAGRVVGLPHDPMGARLPLPLLPYLSS